MTKENPTNKYIHGTTKEEQGRLKLLNSLTNASFIDFLGKSPRDNLNNKRIVDFGCGTGDLVAEIAEMYPKAKITGIEISKAQFEAAVETNQKNPNVTLINGDVMKSGLKDITSDISFDIIYCRYLLEHVPDPVNVVKEMLSVTKPNGAIKAQENDLANVFYYPEFEGLDKLHNEFCAMQIDHGGDPFIGRKLFDIFKRAGAKNITLTYEPEIYTEDDPERYRAWLTNSLNIYQGAKAGIVKRGNIDEADINRLLNLMEDRIKKPQGVALFHWNRVSASKA